MLTPADEALLRRALRLAMNGRGRVEPNPMVGCVLAKGGAVIGEGFHARFGGPHAEPTALADCHSRGNAPAGATAYVTLEPCCHLNKKTPPCAPRLIEAGIARVVIGCLDPNPDVNGNGVTMLRDAGIIVDPAPPALADEFRQLIAPFTARPFYATLKWAESADGFVAGAGGTPVRVSGPAADRAVHRLRTRCDAIAIGRNTLLTDDPSLTVRGVEVVRRPVRIVLDRALSMPLTAKMLIDASPAATGQDVLVVADAEHFGYRLSGTASAQVLSHSPELPPSFRRLQDKDARVVGVFAYKNGTRAVFEEVAVVQPMTHLMVEAGPRLAAAVLPWADRLWVLRSNLAVEAGPTAPRAPAVPDHFIETGRVKVGTDTLVEYLNRDADSFVTATPSADFVRERDLAFDEIASV